jgi:hypothetical protein
MDKDGARIEGTGRAPYDFTVRAYFLNGLTPGMNESWKDPLFPGVWINVRKALEARGSNFFQHPLYGLIYCKPVTWSESFTADVRSGVIVEMSFIEDMAFETPTESTITQDIKAIAQNLDAGRSAGLGAPPKSLGDSWEGAVLNIDLLHPFQALTKITSMIEALFQNIQDLENKYDPYHIGLSYIDSYYKFIEGLQEKRDGLLNTKKETVVYKVLKNSTLDSVAQFTGNNIDDLLFLNPGIGNSPVITQGSLVNYYV